jgi:hypothetical protein
MKWGSMLQKFDVVKVDEPAFDNLSFDEPSFDKLLFNELL